MPACRMPPPSALRCRRAWRIESAGPHKRRADRCAEALGEADAHRVEVRGPIGGRDAGGDDGVEQPRAVEMPGEAVVGGPAADLGDRVVRLHAARAAVVRVLQAHQPRADAVVVARAGCGPSAARRAARRGRLRPAARRCRRAGRTRPARSRECGNSLRTGIRRPAGSGRARRSGCPSCRRGRTAPLLCRACRRSASSSRCTVGSSPNTSSPTSAAAIAARMPGVGGSRYRCGGRSAVASRVFFCEVSGENERRRCIIAIVVASRLSSLTCHETDYGHVRQPGKADLRMPCRSNIQRIDTRQPDAQAAIAQLRAKLAPSGNVVSEAGRQKTIEVFGEPLSPAEVVERICSDVARKAARSRAPIHGQARRRAALGRQRCACRPSELAAAHAAAAPEFLGNDPPHSRQHPAVSNGDPAPRRAGRTPHGGYLRQRYLPLERVGICVPGGAAAYPSTVLMTAVPAQAAGVDRDRRRRAADAESARTTRTCSPRATSWASAKCIAWAARRRSRRWRMASKGSRAARW